MLVVRGRKATDPLSPFHRVQGLATTDTENMEGDREGPRVKHPRTPAMKRVCKEKSTEAVLEMSRDTRIRCISTRRVHPGERLGDEIAGSGNEGGKGVPGPPSR